jgi:hypothetical protein
MEILADGRHIEKAIHALDHSDEVQAHESKAAELREEKKFVETYFAPGAPLSYPNNLLFLAVLRSAAVDLAPSVQDAVTNWYRADFTVKPSVGARWIQETNQRLAALFSSVTVKEPGSPQEAVDQSAAIVTAINAFKKYLGSAFKYEDEQKDPGSWPTPKEFLAIREAFLSYLGTHPDPEKIWNYLQKTRGFVLDPRGDYDYYYYTKMVTFSCGGISLRPDYYRLPNPRLSDKPGFFGRMGLASSRDGYNSPDTQRLRELSKQIQTEERAIAKLLGKAPPPPEKPVIGSYAAPPSVVKAIDSQDPSVPAGGAREALHYREQVEAAYLSGGGFFGSAPATGVERNPDPGLYETIFSTYSPSHIPVLRDDGTYDPEKLAAFRELTRALGVTPEKYIDYARELQALSQDPKAKAEVLAILQDRKEGNPRLLALREIAGAHGTPLPEVPSKPIGGENEPRPASPAVPYARPMTTQLNLHNALTELARETARRGSRAVATELLRDLAKASRGLEKDLRRNSLVRERAIEKLSPPIDRALSEAQALGIDLAQMQSHAEAVRQQIDTLLKETTERAKILSESANKETAGSSATLAAALEAVSMELDQLKSQSNDADYLRQSLTALRANLRENREYLIGLQSVLRRTDPQHPNQIDNRLLSEALAKLPPVSR